MNTLLKLLANSLRRIATQKNMFILTGITSTLWFLLRVIPKPTRATYPCMRAAAPIMSAFVCYCLSFFGVVFSYQLFKANLKKARYLPAVVCLTVFVLALIAFNLQHTQTTQAIIIPMQSLEQLNASHISTLAGDAIGVPQGIKPGRVVWVWDNRATDNNAGDQYVFPEKNDQYIIDRMLTASVISAAGEDGNEGSKDIIQSWNKIFTYFNNKRAERYGEIDRANRSYQAGEKVFIKTNRTSRGNKSNAAGQVGKNRTIVESNAFTVLALIKHLIEYVGVDQEDIVIGDPMCGSNSWDVEYIHASYPRVKFIEVGASGGLGVDIPGPEDVLFYSSINTLRDVNGKGPYVNSDKIHIRHHEADYVFNVPAIKGHESAGFSAVTKNFFGCNTRGSAQHYHPTLVSGSEGMRTEYNTYRVQMDLLASKWMGQKTVLHITDGLYSGDRWDGVNVKWSMLPFSNSYPSSLFVSLDIVAIESVCFDFLRAEYKNPDILSDKKNFPSYPAADDYLHQAADPTQRPPHSFEYNPDGNHVINYSLGVHEHWDEFSKTYKTIDFVKLKSSTLTSSSGYKWENMDNYINFPGKNDPIIVPHTDALVIDGDHTKEIWANQPWKSMNFRWLDGKESGTVDYPSFKSYDDITPYGYHGVYKLLWNKTNKELYILTRIKDDILIEDETTNKWDPIFWANYDILEIYFAPEKTSGNHELNDDGQALHVTIKKTGNNTWIANHALSLAPAGSADYLSRFINASMIKKVGDYYYWEISLNLTSVPDAKMVDGGSIKFSIAYNDVDAPNKRTGQYGNVYLKTPDERISPFKYIENMGTIQFKKDPGSDIPLASTIVSMADIFTANKMIAIRNLKTSAQCRIFDTQGKLLFQQQLQAGDTDLPTQTLGYKVVIVSLESSKEKQTVKLVIN